jgi:hypothetical protein
LGLQAFLFFLPRLELLSFRDLLEAPGLVADPGLAISLLVRGTAYAALYAGACFSLSLPLFSRKEF